MGQDKWVKQDIDTKLAQNGVELRFSPWNHKVACTPFALGLRFQFNGYYGHSNERFAMDMQVMFSGYEVTGEVVIGRTGNRGDSAVLRCVVLFILLWAVVAVNPVLQAANLMITTKTVPGVLFEKYDDKPYDFQFYGEGGSGNKFSGNYLWTVSGGNLGEGFTLGSNTGILTGSFNLLKMRSLSGFGFDLKMSDRELISGKIGAGNTSGANLWITVAPDLGNYGWNIEKSGGYHVSTSTGLEDYCYILFEGVELDMYFGTKNSKLDLPSKLELDGVDVTMNAKPAEKPADWPINKTWPQEWTKEEEVKSWTATGYTQWVRYRIATGLNDKKHILKMVAPKDQKNTLTSTGNHIGGYLSFESMLVERAMYSSNLVKRVVGNMIYEDPTGEPVSSGNYYVQSDVLPDHILYRSGNSIPRFNLVVDPAIKLIGNSIRFDDLPQAEAVRLRDEASVAVVELKKDAISAANLLAQSDNLLVSATLIGTKLTVADNLARSSILDKLGLVESSANILLKRSQNYVSIAGNAASAAANLVQTVVATRELATETAASANLAKLLSGNITSLTGNVFTLSGKIRSSLGGNSQKPRPIFDESTAMESPFDESTAMDSPVGPSIASPMVFVHPRSKSTTSSLVPYLEVYDANERRTGTLFANDQGEIPMPQSGAVFRLAWGDPSDATNNYGTALTTRDDMIRLYGSKTQTATGSVVISTDSTASVTISGSSADGNGGSVVAGVGSTAGGGGCLLR